MKRQSGDVSIATRALTGLLVIALVFPPLGAVGQQFPGNVQTNGAQTGITVANGFAFEPEVPFTSLKNAPIWSELEQLLDNPYAFTADPSTPGNDQGFPSYRSSIVRRPGFGVVLPQFLVHPLNYNTTTGEEMRLINPRFPQTNFAVTDDMRLDPGADPALGPYRWWRVDAAIAPGAARVEPGSIPIDYNNPIGADPNGAVGPGQLCVTTTELNPPEGSLLCGGDPGEPGYFGFGVLRPIANYSTPAVPLSLTTPPAQGTGFTLATTHRLYDPQRLTAPDGLAGVIPPRNAAGAFGLRKPSLRIPQVSAANGVAGSPARPAYTANALAAGVPLVDQAAPVASNENDFIRSQPMARVLGKALFWDMQVGSDGIQSCGTCHFNGTGTDTRVKNQLNPNHLGNDLTLQVGSADLDPANPAAGKAANYTLTPADFPLHRVTNPEVAGDPACTSPLVANVGAIPYAATPAGYQPSQAFSNPPGAASVTVCDSGNIESDRNDVVSSMGVHWGVFKDIAPIGTFVGTGVTAVGPDLRESAADCAAATNPTECVRNISDPIPAFKGAAGTNPLDAGVLNEFRRVEPRNTPTMQAAAFNFDNFWDGRARHDFNGGSVFGAADPQGHVFVCESVNPAGTTCTGADLVPTRQVIRFVSLASLATGPGLSEFEMSFLGRNWSKVGKKLLQPAATQTTTPSPVALQGGVTPLANQLVSPTDSLLGPYSNQGGTACGTLPAADRSPAGLTATAAGKPGLCISYPALIRQAFYPALWGRAGRHLDGCYTDGRTEIHPNQCGTTVNGIAYPAAAIPVLAPATAVVAAHVADSAADPFDGYVLTVANGAATRNDTNQFTQMEGNFSLFWGLSVNAWVQILVPDDTPFDRLLDANPGAFRALGEPGEPGLVPDLLNCGTAGADPSYCFTPVGNFKRDNGLTALQTPAGEGGAGGTLVTVSGTRNPGDPDPLLGLDLFFASNLSLKNPNFRTGRCGECHAIPTLTDHTMPFTSKINLMDAVAEFATPGVELVVEPLARLRVISGFLLESEIAENGQDAVERRIVDQSIVPSPVDGFAYPGASEAGLTSLDGTSWGAWTGADSAFLDNGIYNLGIRPIAEDVGRGGNDAFGWPLSLATLMMKNLEGPGFNPGGDDPSDGFAQPALPGAVMQSFDPTAECFGLFETTAQDQRINPGCEGEPANPQIPAYLGAFANNITVGDFPPEMDEAGGAIGGMVNTVTDLAMIEGFMDTLGPFNPGNVAAEVLNYGGFSSRAGDVSAQMGTWPMANRVGRMGSFKAAQLRNVELTGPYFHNGGKLTLRQVVDFYTRGGDFPVTNKAHRDFNLVNMNIEIQSNLSEAEKVALVDFLLELTDDRNRYDRAPFDHPEVIVPLDGRAPDNGYGHAGLAALTGVAGECTGATALTPAAGNCFQRVPEVGAAGNATPEPSFLNVIGIQPDGSRVRLVGADANRGTVGCDYTGELHGGVPTVSQYCH